MTPTQQTALEGLAGRSLTAPELAQIDVLLPIRNDVAIAEILSLGRVKSEIVIIGSGTVLNTMERGGEFLDLLTSLGATDRNIYWSMDLIKQGRLELGGTKVKAQLQQMATLKPDFAADIAALLALCEKPDPVHFNAVSDALNIAEGRNTL